jgi:hypothetical protein
MAVSMLAGPAAVVVQQGVWHRAGVLTRALFRLSSIEVPLLHPTKAFSQLNTISLDGAFLLAGHRNGGVALSNRHVEIFVRWDTSKWRKVTTSTTQPAGDALSVMHQRMAGFGGFNPEPRPFYSHSASRNRSSARTCCTT